MTALFLVILLAQAPCDGHLARQCSSQQEAHLKELDRKADIAGEWYAWLYGMDRACQYVKTHKHDESMSRPEVQKFMEGEFFDRPTLVKAGTDAAMRIMQTRWCPDDYASQASSAKKDWLDAIHAWLVEHDRLEKACLKVCIPDRPG